MILRVSQGEIFLHIKDLPANRFAACFLFGGHLVSYKVMVTGGGLLGLTAVGLLAKIRTQKLPRSTRTTNRVAPVIFLDRGCHLIIY